MYVLFMFHFLLEKKKKIPKCLQFAYENYV